jgi:hypothetical protein
VSDSLASTPDGAGRGVAKPSRQLRLGLREGISDGWAVGSNATLADLVGARTSGLGLFYVLMYVGLWGRYLDEHGEPPPSNRQLARAFKLAPRTVDRYRDRFDDAFPELDDPAQLYDAVRFKLAHDTVTGESPEVWAFKLGGAEL